MEPLTVDPRRPAPPSRQLVEGFLDRIASGVLGPGERLPSVRALAADVLVNPNTVGKAYRDLEALGVAAGRSGSGVYVTDDARERARELRGSETRDDLVRAWGAARAAGHRQDDLLTLLGVEPAVASEGNER